MTIRYRDSSVDSNIPGTSLDQEQAVDPACRMGIRDIFEAVEDPVAVGPLICHAYSAVWVRADHYLTPFRRIGDRVFDEISYCIFDCMPVAFDQF